MKHAIVIGGSVGGLLAPAFSPAISSESRLSNGTVSLKSASNAAGFLKDGTLMDCLRVAGALWMNYSPASPMP